MGTTHGTYRAVNYYQNSFTCSNTTHFNSRFQTNSHTLDFGCDQGQTRPLNQWNKKNSQYRIYRFSWQNRDFATEVFYKMNVSNSIVRTTIICSLKSSNRSAIFYTCTVYLTSSQITISARGQTVEMLPPATRFPCTLLNSIQYM